MNPALISHIVTMLHFLKRDCDVVDRCSWANCGLKIMGDLVGLITVSPSNLPEGVAYQINEGCIHQLDWDKTE